MQAANTDYPHKIRSESEYNDTYQRSVKDPEGFWAEIAGNFHWQRKWDSVLDFNFEEPRIEWFKGAKLNITENCIDRWALSHPDKAAIQWEPNNPSESHRTITYAQLLQEVSNWAKVLKSKGIGKGDRVCLYMPMIPELAFAVLACARIGAIHSVIFGGFSPASIADRVKDASAKAIVTADSVMRGAKKIALKNIIDTSLEDCTVETVIVFNRNNDAVKMKEGRDFWYSELAEKVDLTSIEPAEIMDSEAPLFILYTSGSTGKPKGVVHTCGGYMVYTNYSFLNVFQYEFNDVYFCTADIGWITGHSYILYGPLSAGATTLMFEGIPNYPSPSRFWEITDKFKVNQLYTAPTAIRSLMSCGLDQFEKTDLSSLKVLGTVGEPINKEAWDWYFKYVGKKQCPIVDTWWQTETGGILISNLAGITKHKPTYATKPLPGIRPALMDEKGLIHSLSQANLSTPNTQKLQGNLVVEFPWPGMIRTVWGDHKRCKQTYFSAYSGKYFTGDGCFKDTDQDYRITGRVDDVLNVSGHRIGTAEVENAINACENVIESAVIGYPHPIKGEGIYAYIICQGEVSQKAVNDKIKDVIGPIAKCDKVQLVSGLPKTRSGKIMRRILRKIASGEQSWGDASTLLNPEIVDEIWKNREV